MVKKAYQIVWTTRSQQHIRAAYKYISTDSPKNAAKVIADILTAVEKATINPEYYGPDKYKKDNDGRYQAFEKHRYTAVDCAYMMAEEREMIYEINRVRHDPTSYLQYLLLMPNS